jgi:hypothetical protein
MMLMVSVAMIFYVAQAAIGLMFLSPEMLGGGATAIITTKNCESIFHLGTTICTAVGALSGIGAGLLIGTADALLGGSITASSNAVGAMLASLVGLASFILFSLWYLSAGIKFFEGPRAMQRFYGYAAQGILGEIPFVQLAPVIPLSVLFVCIQARLEDKEQKQMMQKKAELAQTEEMAKMRRFEAIQAARAQQEESEVAQFAQAT